MERADENQEVVIDPNAVSAALEKLNRDPEPEARFMRMAIFGQPRFLLRGLAGAQLETSLATLAYNLKTMIAVLGGRQLVEMLAR